MSSKRKQTVWLVACMSITCCLRQVAQCSQAAPASHLGIVFPQDERPFLVPQQRARQFETNERPKQQQQQSLARALDDDEHWQSRRLHLVEPDGEVSAEQRARLNHIREVLDTITGTIPPSPSRLRSFQRSGASLDGGEPPGRQQARHGRPLTRSYGVPARTQRRHGTLDDSTPNERVNARDSGGPKGIVWPADPLAGGQYQKTRPAPIVGKLARSRPIDEQLNQKFGLLTAGAFDTGHLYPPEQMARKSHRSGSEEVPIQTPIHSRPSGGDYETKRVENTRGWNNLRGMWGKRSTEVGESNRPTEGLQVDSETRQALNLLMGQQLELNNVAGGAGGDAPPDYAGNDESKGQQWRSLMSAGDLSISSM